MPDSYDHFVKAFNDPRVHLVKRRPRKPAPPTRPDVRDDRRRPVPPPKKLTYLEKRLLEDAKRLKKRMEFDRKEGVGFGGP